MKIYLASGYSVINVKNRERELLEKFIYFPRLFSFADVNASSIEDRIKDHINYFRGFYE